MTLPVSEVYGAQTSDNLKITVRTGIQSGSPYQLQLPLVEGLERVLRDQFMEAFLQSEELLLNSLHEPEHVGVLRRGNYIGDPTYN